MTKIKTKNFSAQDRFSRRNLLSTSFPGLLIAALVPELGIAEAISEPALERSINAANNADSISRKALCAQQGAQKANVYTYAMSQQMTISRPTHEVWPCLLKYREWNPEHIGAKVERLAGEKDREGEVIAEAKRTREGYGPPIIIETVKLVPNETVVWAMYLPESGASNGLSFVDFSLWALDDQTLFTYHLYGWKSDPIDKDFFQRSVMERVNKNLPALKAYAEKAR